MFFFSCVSMRVVERVQLTILWLTVVMRQYSDVCWQPSFSVSASERMQQQMVEISGVL